MRSGRSSLIPVYLAVVILAAIALLTASSSQAARPFGLWSLDGAYHFSLAEIRAETFPAPMTVYCNAYGVIEFDGAGSAEILAGTGMGWCRDADGGPVPGDPAESGCFEYEVFDDGSVIITDLTEPPECAPRPPGEQYTSHCQILDKGELLVCDGTGGGGDVPPDRLLWTVTAGKL